MGSFGAGVSSSSLFFGDSEQSTFLFDQELHGSVGRVRSLTHCLNSMSGPSWLADRSWELCSQQSCVFKLSHRVDVTAIACFCTEQVSDAQYAA